MKPLLGVRLVETKSEKTAEQNKRERGLVRGTDDFPRHVFPLFFRGPFFALRPTIAECLEKAGLHSPFCVIFWSSIPLSRIIKPLLASDNTGYGPIGSNMIGRGTPNTNILCSPAQTLFWFAVYLFPFWNAARQKNVCVSRLVWRRSMSHAPYTWLEKKNPC